MASMRRPQKSNSDQAEDQFVRLKRGETLDFIAFYRQRPRAAKLFIRWMSEKGFS